MNVVHIGFPKTATTFLQWEVFPHIENWNFIDYYQSHQVFMDLIYLDELDYDEEQVSKKLKQFIKEGNNIASYESLAGAPFSFKGLGRSNIPKRLKKLGFDKVVITIRNQTEAIDSLYRQYVVQGGVMRFDDFLNVDEKWNPYLRAFNLSYLKYDKLIRIYHEVFGRENVLVLYQEELKKDKATFLGKLEAFLNAQLTLPENQKKANQSLSNFSIGLLRLINHFTYNSQRPNQLIWNQISSKNIWKIFVVILEPYFLKWFFKKKPYLSKFQNQFLSSYYEESNCKTKELIESNG